MSGTEIKVMNNDEIRDFCIKKDLKIFELEQENERLHSIIEQIEGAIYNNQITGIEARITIQEILDKENI